MTLFSVMDVLVQTTINQKFDLTDNWSQRMVVQPSRLWYTMEFKSKNPKPLTHDVFSDMAPNTPSTGNSVWRIWHLVPGNGCWWETTSNCFLAHNSHMVAVRGPYPRPSGPWLLVHQYLAKQSAEEPPTTHHQALCQKKEPRKKVSMPRTFPPTDGKRDLKWSIIKRPQMVNISTFSKQLWVPHKKPRGHIKYSAGLDWGKQLRK